MTGTSGMLRAPTAATVERQNLLCHPKPLCPSSGLQTVLDKVKNREKVRFTPWLLVL